MKMTIDLKPISREDLPGLLAWRNDWGLIDWTRQSDILNEVEHSDWFERQARDQATRMYKIVLTTPDAVGPVGVCGLTSIDYRNSRAEFSLYVASAFQKRGIGKNALSALLGHAFQNLGLYVVWGESFDGNPAIPMFESLGMVREGTRRNFYWKNGKRIDAHLFSITRDEWNGQLSDRTNRDAGDGKHSNPGLPVANLAARRRRGAPPTPASRARPPSPDGPGAA